MVKNWFEVPANSIYNNCMLIKKEMKFQVMKGDLECSKPLTFDEAIKAIRSLEEAYLMFHPGAPIPFVLMPVRDNG
tara:strand:+ start:1303 stop:1530 length:228 start_codon:yes stop_codon:yes gene_type:complete